MAAAVVQAVIAVRLVEKHRAAVLVLNLRSIYLLAHTPLLSARAVLVWKVAHQRRKTNRHQTVMIRL